MVKDMSRIPSRPVVKLVNLGTALEFWIENRDVTPLRIWNRSNSWGWPTTQLIIASKASPTDRMVLVPKSRIWTRNGPGFVELPPSGAHLIMLRPGDPTWEELSLVDPLQHGALVVQGTLRIPPSPEARQFKVFIGEVTSEPCESEPPHGWLFAKSAEKHA
jgi:hypothetical protein